VWGEPCAGAKIWTFLGFFGIVWNCLELFGFDAVKCFIVFLSNLPCQVAEQLKSLKPSRK
jgi:hypothetical protein